MARPSSLRTWTRAEIDTLREQTIDDTGVREIGPPLSGRQLQVLMLMAEGLTADQIAGRLFVSRATVKTHQIRLYEVLGARNAAHAVSLGYQSRLLTVDRAVS